MGKTGSHPNGCPNWFELATTDQSGAKAFYQSVFGWTAEDRPIGGDAFYSIFESEGAEVAAAYTMMEDEVAMGLTSHWRIYFQVANCDAAAARAAELGGKVLVEPFDVMQHLRMAVVADPQGAVFQLSQPRQQPGVGAIRKDNAITWIELATSDLPAAEDFYRRLFGWTLDKHQDSPMPYRLIITDDGRTGGMMPTSKDWGKVPPHWSIYVQVADVDVTAQKVVAAGGRINIPAFDVDTVGRMAQIADPSGASMHIITLASADPATNP